MWGGLAKLCLGLVLSIVVVPAYAQEEPENAEIQTDSCTEDSQCGDGDTCGFSLCNSDDDCADEDSCTEGRCDQGTCSGASIDASLEQMARPKSSPEDLSPQEMQSRATDGLREMQTWQEGLARRLGEARQQQDMVLMNCLNPLLTRVKGFLSIANAAITNFITLVASGNLSDALHEFEKLMMALSRAGDAHSSSGECVDSNVLTATDDGKSQTTMTIDSPDGEEWSQDTSEAAADDATGFGDTPADDIIMDTRQPSASPHT